MWKRLALGFGALACCILVGAVLWTTAGRQAREITSAAQVAHEVRAVINDMGRQKSIREIEKWTPDKFFHQPTALQACQAISDRKLETLKQLLDAGLDPNTSGKSGFTLLHWAYVDDNFEAFKLLLKAGADPDNTLTETIVLQHHYPFFRGDSILFTGLQGWRPSKLEFLHAALDHTSERDPRDSAGNTLLLRCTAPSGHTGITNEIVAKIIKLGVDLDAQSKTSGATAAHSAVSFFRPDIALQILKAGADPQIADHSGHTVSDNMQTVVQNWDAGRPLRDDYKRLKEWLDRHSKKSSQ